MSDEGVEGFTVILKLGRRGFLGGAGGGGGNEDVTFQGGPELEV